MEININCDLGETSKFCSTENDPLLLGIAVSYTHLTLPTNREV